jgi:hypothetical protein
MCGWQHCQLAARIIAQRAPAGKCLAGAAAAWFAGERKWHECGGWIARLIKCGTRRQQPGKKPPILPPSPTIT